MYRRPEFDETKPSIPQSHSAQAAAPLPPANVAPGKDAASHPSTVKIEPQSGTIHHSHPFGPSVRQADASNRLPNGPSRAPPPESRPPPLGHVPQPNVHHTRNGVQNNHAPPAQQASTSRAPPTPAPAPVQRQPPEAPESEDDPDIDIPTVLDESFGLDSDEDAFYATVDLGENDLGQPIVADDDGGRPIDFEEGLRPDDESMESMDMSTGTNMPARAPATVGQQRPEANSNIRSSGAPIRSNGVAAGNANASLSSSRNGSGQTNQNLSRRTSTSSMGGSFNFPPGMTAADFTRSPQHNMPPPPPPPQGQRHQPPSNLKRSADTMR